MLALLAGLDALQVAACRHHGTRTPSVPASSRMMTFIAFLVAEREDINPHTGRVRRPSQHSDRGRPGIRSVDDLADRLHALDDLQLISDGLVEVLLRRTSRASYIVRLVNESQPGACSGWATGSSS